MFYTHKSHIFRSMWVLCLYSIMPSLFSHFELLWIKITFKLINLETSVLKQFEAIDFPI